MQNKTMVLKYKDNILDSSFFVENNFSGEPSNDEHIKNLNKSYNLMQFTWLNFLTSPNE